MMTEAGKATQELQESSILFADIEGFTTLSRFQQSRYLEEVLGRMAAVLDAEGNSPLQASTWGDGLMAFFQSRTAAVRCALALRDSFRTAPWQDRGLPRLRIRISLHVGEVIVGENPVTRRKEIIGTEVNRAARIEPIVTPNHVYATERFASSCDTDGVAFHDLGEILAAKGWGTERLYLAAWGHENIDTQAILSGNVLGPRGRINFNAIFRNSKFGQRLEVSRIAKQVIARYCATGDFWNAGEAVFVESGTLPLYLIRELLAFADPKNRPKHIITNNLLCSALALAAPVAFDESAVVYPEDRPSDCTVLGGIVLEDYAATIPPVLTQRVGGPHEPKETLGYLQGLKLNHVVMMVAKITAEDGPCAVSAEMRRFKKLLMQYVATTGSSRLSILAEAEKLCCRRGWAADTIDLPGSEESGYWLELQGSGRVQVISALSPEMGEADVGLARREISALRRSGVASVLLDANGNVIDAPEAS